MSEERLQRVVCYRAGDEPRRLDLEEKRETEDLKPVGLLAGLPASPAGVTSIPVECMPEWKTG